MPPGAGWVSRPTHAARCAPYGRVVLSPTVLAGSVSTAIFAVGMLPMVVKAVATRDLRSYSLSSLALVNVGNAVHSVYVG